MPMESHSRFRLRPWAALPGLLLLVLAEILAVTPAVAENFIVYAGSYTDSPSTSKGIYAARFETGSGKIEPIGLVAKTVNPAFLSGTADGRFLYAVNWQTPAVAAGGLDTVSAYRIDRNTAALHLLNTVSAGGALPNQDLVDPSGRVLIVANYGAHAKGRHNAGMSAMKIAADGRLTQPFFVDVHPDTSVSGAEVASHVHGIAFSKDNRYVFIADLGLDRIYTYRFDAAKPSLAQAAPAYVQVAPHSGPRRLVLSADGKFLYCNQQDSSKVIAFRIDDGRLRKIQELSTLPKDYKGRNATAEIAIGGQGHYLYVSNRGADSIAVYQIDTATGALTWRQSVPSRGKSPRNMTFDPTGAYLFVANQASNNVVVFRCDPKTGRITPTNQVLDVPQAASIFFVKAGQKS